mgnify:CR=1 FL=1
MQVGDLVRLSAYGNKVKTNYRYIGPNDLGLIIRISKHPDFPFGVKWMHVDLPFDEKMRHSRKDLKHASR